ncbi:PREDICTED: uncharacterized protein LOC108374305 [Rhagoletis zephyria]|uniref:uncharacterized protein LOC108374305 n=1 Tax=Rhagoletis zephyria TaxID=28612 RepID=UPI00081124A8|nr:PREDICTED: uncharacterized protein LOC108374305 [Rhagoletis zephyria]
MLQPIECDVDSEGRIECLDSPSNDVPNLKDAPDDGSSHDDHETVDNSEERCDVSELPPKDEIQNPKHLMKHQHAKTQNYGIQLLKMKCRLTWLTRRGSSQHYHQERRLFHASGCINTKWTHMVKQSDIRLDWW